MPSAALFRYAEYRQLDPVRRAADRGGSWQARVGETITEGRHRRSARAVALSPGDSPGLPSTDPTRAISPSSLRPSDAAAMFDLVVGASSIYGGSWLRGCWRGVCREPGPPLDRRPAPLTCVWPGCSCRGARSTRARWWPRGRTARATHPGNPALSGSPRPTGALRLSPRPARHGRRGRRRCVRDDFRMDADLRRSSKSCVLRRSSPSSPRGDHELLVSSATWRRSVPSPASTAWFPGRRCLCWRRRARCPSPSARSGRGDRPADSLHRRPHKWLFAPCDCCASCIGILPSRGAAHTQKAGYLDVPAPMRLSST